MFKRPSSSSEEATESFSLPSTRDGGTIREADGTVTDGGIGDGWHRSARDKLAERVHRVVEAQVTEEI